MIELLSKWFIKDRNNYQDNKVREAYGSLTGTVGIFLNILICVGKIIVGVFSGAISVIADGINNLTDAGSSVITILGFKISNKPIDRKHPFGHGRMEYIAAMIVSIIIIVVGVELIISSVQKIITPEEVHISIVTMIILAISVAVKLYMFAYNYVWAKKLNSTAMKATAYDSISDAVSTFVVLICTIITYFTGFGGLDSYAGILVALFILFTGFRSFIEIMGDLLGKQPEKEFVDKIEEFVLRSEIVHGIHDLIIHDYGPGRMMVTLHAEVPADMDIMKVHDEIDNIEENLSKEFNCHVTIHMDPVFRNDSVVENLRHTVSDIAKSIYPGFSIHDFRMNQGPTHTNLIFDLVAPYECKMSEEDICLEMEKRVKEVNNSYNIVIQVDRPFV